MASAWDELEEVKTDNWGYNAPVAKQNKVKSPWDELEEVPSTIDDEYNMDFKDPQKNSGFNLGAVKENGQNLLRGGVNMVKQMPQVLNAVNEFKNNVQTPVVNAGRAVARPLLPKGIENKFIGSQEEEALLNKFNGVQFPSYQELAAQYQSGKMPKDVYLQTLKDKLAVENARLDKNYRDWRNTEWGKEGLLLGLSALPATSLAAGTAVAAPAVAATQIPRAVQLANLAKTASIAGAKEAAKFGAKYGVGASLIDKNANPITEPLKDALEFGAWGALLNPAIMGGAGAIAGAIKAGVPQKIGQAISKGAENIKKGAEDLKGRANPNNWEKETVYEKNPFNNTFEPKERWQYKPKDAPEPRNITPEPKQVAGEETKLIQELAPKTAAKIEQTKVIPSGKTINQSGENFGLIPDNLINNSQVRQAYKPKQYKVVNGKTVEITPESATVEKLAPNVAASMRVKNTENLQANETAGQEGNTKDKERKDLVNQAYAVLAQASGKDINYVRMTLNNKGKSLAAKKRAEKLQFLLEEPDDKLSADKSVLAGYEGYFGNPEEIGDAEVVRNALKIIEGKDTTAIGETERKLNEYGEYLKEIDDNVQKVFGKIKNSENNDSITNILNVDLKELEAHGNNIDEDTWADIYKRIDEKISELGYNNKEVNTNEQGKILSETEGLHTERESNIRAEEGDSELRGGIVPRSIKENSGKQIAIEGLEEESARSVQKQQDEVVAKENKEKYSTTQGGVQNQMFNTEQFKNGQQMLFDTSNMPKNESETKKTFEIPEDYKTQVKNYTKEQHEHSASVLGDRMAEAAKKANAGINKDDGGKQYKTYSEKFEEYKAYKEWHEEQAKNLENKPQSFPEVKKTTVTMKSGKEKEIEYVEEVPEGYTEVKDATTAPLGYTWYTNGKSIISGERKNILVKDKNAIVEENNEKSIAEIWKERWEEINNDDSFKISETDTADDILEKRKRLKDYIVKGHTVGGEVLDAKAEEYLNLMERLDEKMFTEQNKRLKEQKTAQVEPKSEQVKPKEGTSKKPSKKKESKKLDDAGEFLQGNRKQDTSLTWDELKDMNDLIRAKNTTKAKVYPKPTLDELEKEGFSEFQAGVILNVYNKINAKPAAGYDKIEHQKLYVDTVNEVMSSIKDYIKSHSDEFSTDLIVEAERNARSWSYDYNQSLFDVIFPDAENKKTSRYSSIFRLYPEYNRKAIIVGGNKFTGALQLSRGTLVDIMKAIEDAKRVKETGGKVKKEPWEKNFVILEPDRWNKEYAVANKNSKQVYAKYATKEEAIAAVKRVQEKIDAFKDKKENFERDYIERRENNKDVTTEELRKAFEFRGVNFGNWTNEKERQNFVNFAYDSLYDLAELLNLPPKALSLNGQLGLAYGAQGTGGKKAAAAHYIPEYKDINLTKEYGAGSLAHEWWHALDNYFGNQATNKEYSREWALSITNSGELRPELFEALENLQTQIKKSPFTEEDIKKNAERLTARYNRNIEYYAQNIKDSYKRTKNADELLNIVDDLVKNKEKYKKYTTEQLQEIENKFFKLLPENRDTLTNRGEFNWFLNSISRLNDIDELARKGANKSEYLQNAEKIDRQSGGKYWSEDTELGARAFAAYIFDKMESQNILNKFLTRSGDGAVLNLDAFKELAEGEEKESLIISTTPKGEERKRIFDAFDNLFNTIKTRPTEKGVELYSDTGLGGRIDNGAEAEELINKAIAEGVKVKDVANEQIFDGMRDIAEQLQDYILGKMPSSIYSDTTFGAHLNGKKAILINNDVINSIEDEVLRGIVFKNTIRHEFEHALQEKEFYRILENYGISDKELNDIRKFYKDSYNYEKYPQQDVQKIIRNINERKIDKTLKNKGLNESEIQHIKDYIECEVVNQRRQNYINKYGDEIDKFNEETKNLSEEEYNKRVIANKIIDGFYKVDYDYKNCNFEKNSNNEANKLTGDVSYERGQIFKGKYAGISSNDEQFRPTSGTQPKIHKATGKKQQTKYTGQEINPLRSAKKKTGRGINDVIRDKVYEWHGNLESDRYDIDKSLNSFIQLTKHRAAEISKKTGLKVSDKQIREIMPFLRERTGFPKSLDREDLRTLFNKLSGAEKAELAKLADTVSDKFEKYYTNYKEAKGEQTSESIENHISHIWDLDKKKKSLLTNYITTNSKFAKQRTIGTFVEGIDGIEINGEKVQFKPKTLDYAEILKASSDNLIKSTHDSVLANEIKNLKINGERMVLPASKAPDEWIEVNHPALNKAVYMGSVGEDELPILMKTPVKVHPEVADYISAIFEVQKPSEFWRTFDALNGMIKQGLLGFSGFHGYALSESAVGNAGLRKTLKELNPKKFVDAIKNGNYDVYKNEESAKRAINAGVQLGTPSDLQRNLVEETLKKIPFVGKYVAGAVSANNKILWDVLHNNFKVMAFNTAIDNLGGNVTKEQERAIAQWVNDSFGGQAWELLGIKKSAIKTASRVLLSPDWNFSTIRQAAAAINSDWLNGKLGQNQTAKRIGKLTGIGEEVGSKGARGKIGRGFWLRSAIYFTAFYNLMNAAFREKDRKEHPERYPKEMTPYDYSIWANSYPMDNKYDRMMPKVFIGRNSDGTARMLRVGKQFREVPEFITEPVSKFGGKTSPLISIASQVGFGMSPADVVKKVTGKEAYLNQDIWNGYGEDAKMREGMDLAKGRAKALGKSLVPYIGSKYIGGKHEFSAWDFVAQTSVGASKGKVYKQAKAAFESGEYDKIPEIKRQAYKDGLPKEQINKMVGYAEKNYKVENTKKYKSQFVTAIGNKDKTELNRIKKDMEKNKLSAAEQRRIYENAWKEYRKNNKS